MAFQQPSQDDIQNYLQRKFPLLEYVETLANCYRKVFGDLRHLEAIKDELRCNGITITKLLKLIPFMEEAFECFFTHDLKNCLKTWEQEGKGNSMLCIYGIIHPAACTVRTFPKQCILCKTSQVFCCPSWNKRRIIKQQK